MRCRPILQRGYKKEEGGTGNGERGTGDRENEGKKPNVNPVLINNSLTHCYFSHFSNGIFPYPLNLGSS